MLGRRSHPRCIVPASVEGVLCVSRDVVVREADGTSVTVISREPGVPGERGELHLLAAGGGVIPVRVGTSRPTAIDGSIRHLLELKPMLEGAIRPV